MIYWWRKIICFAVVDYTFSRILLSKSYIFSRITPCTLYWIQKVHSQKSFIHPSNIQQISLSLLTTKSAKRTSYKGGKIGTLDTLKARKSNWNSIIIQAKPKLEPLFHHEFSAETRSRATRNSTWTIGLQSVDIQQPSETASENDKQLKTSYNKYQQAVKALILSAFYCIHPFPSSSVEPVSTCFLPLFWTTFAARPSSTSSHSAEEVDDVYKGIQRYTMSCISGEFFIRIHRYFCPNESVDSSFIHWQSKL